MERANIFSVESGNYIEYWMMTDVANATVTVYDSETGGYVAWARILEGGNRVNFFRAQSNEYYQYGLKTGTDLYSIYDVESGQYIKYAMKG